MTAKEMFEALDYKIETKSYEIVYYKNANNIIYFNFKDKTFYKSEEYDSAYDDITMKELKAIMQQIKELEWL